MVNGGRECIFVGPFADLGWPTRFFFWTGSENWQNMGTFLFIIRRSKLQCSFSVPWNFHSSLCIVVPEVRNLTPPKREVLVRKEVVRYLFGMRFSHLVFMLNAQK